LSFANLFGKFDGFNRDIPVKSKESGHAHAIPMRFAIVAASTIKLPEMFQPFQNK
jgi:hypothetical protein